METIYQAAEQLIYKHLDLHGALHEACDTSDGKLMATRKAHELYAISLVEAQSTLLGQQTSLLATAHVVQGILEIVDTSIQDHAYILQPHEKETLAMWVNLALAFRSSFLLHPNHFTTCLLKGLGRLPLELLWTLHTEGVVDIFGMCAQMDAEGRVGILLDYLMSSVLALSRHQGREAEEVVIGVTGFLVTLALEPHGMGDQNGAMKEQTLLAAQKIVEDTYSLPHHPLCVCSPLEALVRCPAAIATQFCVSLLARHVHTPPLQPVTGALSIHPQCSYTSLPPHCLALYKKIAEILGADECVKVIQELVEEEINWAAILGFAACLLTTIPHAPERLNDTIHTMVSMAISDMEPHTLYCALVLARHCGQEGSHLFPSYKDWFQQTFADPQSGLLTPKRSLQFFMRCLRDVVPFEPSECLKVHMSCLMKCVPNSHSTVEEYRVLARTRLDDLQEHDPSTEMSSVSTATPPSSHELKSALMDVREAMEDFRKNGVVPQAIREAHMFRAPYFRHRFLPALLNPSVLDDQDDVRQRLVEAMSSAKLIPQKLLVGYRAAMSVKLAQLRELDGDEVQLTSPLVGSLKQLVEAVKQGEVTPGLSALSVAMEMQIQGHQQSRKEDSLSSPVHVQLDLSFPGLFQWEVQLVDSLLSTLLECIVIQASKDSGFPWIQSFLHMLSRHRAVHVALLVRLWELMHVQLPVLTDCQVTCLAILCSEMCGCPQPVQSVSVVTEPCPPHVGTSTFAQEMNTMSLYGSWLLSVLPHSTTPCALATFRFYCIFAEHSLSCCTTDLQAVLPPIVAEKLQYLSSKYSFLEDNLTQEGGASIHDIQSQLAQKRQLLLQWSELLQVYKRLCSATNGIIFGHTQLCFSDWISTELAACHNDLLPRHICNLYWRKTLYEHYLVLPASSGGFGGDIGDAFCQLFAALAKTCMPIPCSCVCSREGGPGDWSNGVQLLQEIALSLLPGVDQLQLARAFQYTQEQDGKEALFRSSYHCKLLAQAQLRVASCLPQCMFFCNTLGDCQSPIMMSQTSALVEHLPLLNDSQVLPLDLTLHLFQGLSQLLRLKDSSREVPFMSQFVHTCPLFGASVLAHWSHIRGAFQLTAAMSIPEILVEVESLSQWVQSSLRLPVPHFDCSEWPLAIGACLFHHIRTSSEAGVGELCAQVKAKLPSLSGKVLCTLLWCSLRDACVNLCTLLSGLEVFISQEEAVPLSSWDPLVVSVGCITADPSTVIMFEGVLSDSVTSGLLADMRRHFQPCQVPCLTAILFMVLSRVSADIFKQLTLQPAFLKLCVTAHRLFLQGIESTWPVSERNGRSDSLVSPHISVSFIEMCRAQTVTAIQQSPPHMAQGCLEHCHDAVKPYCVAQMVRSSL
ncbi:hypothetical protein EMCRGX_G021132 [Ephydatia muelleri]